MDGTDSGDDGRDEPTWVEKREGEWLLTVVMTEETSRHGLRRGKENDDDDERRIILQTRWWHIEMSDLYFFKEEDEGGELTDGDDKWTASDARELNRYQLKRDGQV